MRGRIQSGLFASLLLVGCGVGGSGSNPPAVDAAPGTDGGGPGAPDGSLLPNGGLLVTFVPDPRFPADLGGPSSAFLGKRARLKLRELRVIGDAAPGDERTFHDPVDLDWRCEELECEEEGCECEPGGHPVDCAFPDAPDGIYSSVLARLESYEYRGTATTDIQRDFTITDLPTGMDLTIPLSDVPLSAGGTKVITIAVDVASPVLAVDWSTVTPDGTGVLVVDGASPQIGAVRDEVGSSFTVTSVR